MRYTVHFHEVTGDWLVFDVLDTLELVGMHSSEDEATVHAMTLEEQWRRKQAYCPAPVQHAA